MKARTDGSQMTVIAKNFTTIISMEHFYEDWLFYTYSDYKKPEDGDQLVKISLKDGSTQILDHSSRINPALHISDGVIFYSKRVNDDMVSHKVSIDGGEAEPTGLKKGANVKGVYQGFVYYIEDDILYRLPFNGGSPEIVMTSADGVPFLNIGNGNIFFFWVSSHIYVLPLDAVNADRRSTPYLDVESGMWQQERIWLIGDRIFLQKDLITSGSFDYVDVTNSPLVR
jgi:hypothetical protein